LLISLKIKKPQSVYSQTVEVFFCGDAENRTRVQTSS